MKKLNYVCSVVKSCLTLCDLLECSTQPSLSFTITWSLLKLMSTVSMMPSSHLVLCHPPFSSCLQSFPASGSFLVSQLFASGDIKYWSLSISPFSEYSGLISFRIDLFDLPAVQETLKSLFQYHSLKAAILWFSSLCILSTNCYMSVLFCFLSKTMYIYNGILSFHPFLSL